MKVEDNRIITEGALSGVSVEPFLRYVQTIAVGKDGTIDFTVEVKVNQRSFWLQRFGYEFALADPDAAFTYFGKGPGESYCDMNRYTTYGMWKSTASREYVPYIVPQEHGNHYGVQLLEVTGAFRVTAETPFECNLSQYSTMELLRKAHAAELTKDGTTHIRIDYKNSGIGSNSCGPVLMEQYRLSEKEIHFQFRLTPM